MKSKNSSKIGHNKKNFLKDPVKHIDITSFDSRKIIESMKDMSFASRDTSNAAKILNEMLIDKDCSIFLTLAGSTSAGGCMNDARCLKDSLLVHAASPSFLVRIWESLLALFLREGGAEFT